MHLKLLLLLSVCVALLCETDAWWWSRRNNKQCPSRAGAFPYYFGTTNLWCAKKGKRGAPSRSTLALSHRFIYYRGQYFEFLKPFARIGKTAAYRSKECSSRSESSPAGYSYLSLECIQGCARNYICKFGKFGWLRNNCHKFANRLSAVLCNSGHSCPSWCQGGCNNAITEV